MISRRHLPTFVTIGVFVLGYVLAASQQPAMLSLRVFGNLLTDNAYLGVLAIGMTLVIISGGIDLSVGAVMALSTVLLAAMIGAGLPAAGAIAVTLSIGTAFGAGLGAAIHGLKAPAFIVTLTGMFLARGVALLISTESTPIRDPLWSTLGRAALRLPEGGRLTVLAALMLIAFAIGAALLHRTRFGADVYALGGDAKAAGLMGAPVGRTTVLTYAASGFCAALAGVVFSIYTRSGYALSGVGVELDAIAAVVIGGTLLSGGAGSMIGSLFGVLIQGLIATYITFDGTLSSWWAKIAVGGLLFAFVALQRGLLRLPIRDTSQ